VIALSAPQLVRSLRAAELGKPTKASRLRRITGREQQTQLTNRFRRSDNPALALQNISMILEMRE
jgi:hypothetical protein